MDYLSARGQRLWEAMESCRPGSDDLSDPQFADLVAELAENPELRLQFQRLQQADGAIKAAFADVSVPAGLANRVSRRLSEAENAGNRVQGTGSTAQAVVGSVSVAGAPTLQNALNSLVMSSVAETSPASPAPRRQEMARFSRRRLLVGFSALAAAAALLAAVWFETHAPRHDTPNSVLEEALAFFSNDNQPAGPLASTVAPPAEFPLSRDLGLFPDIRWRRVEKFLGASAVAYDLPTIGGRATLYVVQRIVPGLPSLPPPMPSLSTGGKAAAAWQAGNSLYVLVVEGDAGTYSNYLDHSHGPLT